MLAGLVHRTDSGRKSADKYTGQTDFLKSTIDQAYIDLKSSQFGLTDSEAGERLVVYGRNELVEHKIHPIIKLIKSFWGPIPWMIEAAAILSALIRHWDDFWIIGALLVLNAAVGFWHEYKADNAIEMLKQKLALKARVLRNGAWREIPAAELVPGDVIRMRLGEIAPADVKLIAGEYLLTDESALTGESLPVEKKASDMAYSGSIIRQGEMNGIVTATGMETFFGRTAMLVAQAKTGSHFQKAVIKIGNYLILFASALAGVIFLVALSRREPVMEIFQFIMVLTVAAIPAALPAVLSITMAVGAMALAKKDAIVSRLSSIEEMAGMDVLCSDKTGTITKNELTVADVVPLDGYTVPQVMMYAVLASREEDRDPIDSAIIRKYAESGGAAGGVTGYTVTAFRPFDPVAKRTESAVREKGGSSFKVSKGAPQVILSLLQEGDSSADAVERRVDEFAEKGYRTIGVARTDESGAWRYAGLIPLYDPPRDDSAKTLEAAQRMGVDVKMVTGDHAAIARETARRVGLRADIMKVDSFINEPDKPASMIVRDASGFAQVFPEHKYRIVELLQNLGYIVGMTGDGVNDAPALKKADVGIAVAGATDAAKSAAAIVLTKPGLSVIIDAMRQSRKIFQRMENYAIYRIAETIRVILFITLSIITFRFYPVTAIMIVLLALLNDIPVMAISSDNVTYSDAPNHWDMKSTLGMATFLGIIGVSSSFMIFYIGRELFHLSSAVLQSFIYLKLSVAGHMTVFAARTRGHFWSVKPSRTLFLAVVITQIVATLITVYGFLLPAMGWRLALFVWGYAFVFFIITDFIKVGVYRLTAKKGIL